MDLFRGLLNLNNDEDDSSHDEEEVPLLDEDELEDSYEGEGLDDSE